MSVFISSLVIRNMGQPSFSLTECFWTCSFLWEFSRTAVSVLPSFSRAVPLCRTWFEEVIDVNVQGICLPQWASSTMRPVFLSYSCLLNVWTWTHTGGGWAHSSIQQKTLLLSPSHVLTWGWENGHVSSLTEGRTGCSTLTSCVHAQADPFGETENTKKTPH